MILSITSLLDMLPPCFPTGQRGLWISSLSADLQGLRMAKKQTDLCYPELWPSAAGPGMGRNLPPCRFPDPPDKLVTLILKAVNPALLSDTQFPSSPFWIRDVYSSCLLPQITNWWLTVGLAPRLSCYEWPRVGTHGCLTGELFMVKTAHHTAEYIYYNIKWLKLFILWTSWFSVSSVHLNLF